MSVSCVGDLFKIVAGAANAGVEWASRVSVWDISDDDGEHFLITLDAKRPGNVRLAGTATDLKSVRCADVAAPDAVRHVLDHVGGQAAELLGKLAELISLARR